MSVQGRDTALGSSSQSNEMETRPNTITEMSLGVLCRGIITSTPLLVLPLLYCQHFYSSSILGQVFRIQRLYINPVKTLAESDSVPVCQEGRIIDFTPPGAPDISPGTARLNRTQPMRLKGNSLYCSSFDIG